MIKVGICNFWITLAKVKVFPDPVTPSRTWSFFPILIPAINFLIAWGWSPVGENDDFNLNISATHNCSKKIEGLLVIIL